MAELQSDLLAAKLRNAKLKNALLKKQKVDEDQGIFLETVIPAVNKAAAQTVGFFGDLGELDRMLMVKFRDSIGLDTAELPPELAKIAGAGKLPTSAETQNFFEQLGIPSEPDESTPVRKIVGETTRLATSTALFGGAGVAGAARQGLSTGLRRTGTDLFIGGSAGAAGGVAQNAGVENPLAISAVELIGGLAGSGALGTGRLLTRLTDPLTKRGSRRIVAEAVQEEASNKSAAIANLGTKSRVPQTAFEQTNDIGLARLQKGLFDDAKLAEKIGKIANVRTQQAAQEINNMFPNSGVMDFLTPVGQKYARTLQGLTDKTSKAINKANQILSRPRGTDVVSEEAASLASRNLINKAQDSWDEIGKSLWSQVDDSIVTDTTAFKVTLRDVLRKEARSEHSTNKIPKEIVDKINALKPFDSVKEVQAIRSGILKEIRSDSAGLTPEKARVAKLVKLQVSGLNILQRGAGGDVYKIARQHSFIQNQLFSKGILGDITSLKTTGSDKIEPTATLAVMMGGRNRIENINQAKVAVGQEIDLPLQDFLESQFVRKAFPQGETGPFDPAAAARFMNTNQSSIRMFPQLESRLRRSVAVAASAKRRILKLDKTKEAVKNHSIAAKALKADPDFAVEAALSSNKFTPKQALANLLRTAKRAGGTKAVSGVERAVYRSWLSRSIDDVPDKTFRFNPQKMRAQIEKMGLEGNISQDKIDNMRSIADELGRIEMFARSTGQAASVEQQTSILQILSRMGGARIGASVGGTTGGGSIQSAGIISGLSKRLAVAFEQKKMISVLEEAVDNKQLLTDLLTMPTSKNQIALFRRVTNAVLNMGEKLEDKEQQ